MTEQLSQLNRLVYRIERAFVAFALLTMALVVFLDVLHRATAGERSKGIDASIKVIGWVGPELTEGTSGYDLALKLIPWVAFAIFAGLGWAAVRAATRGRTPHTHAAAAGVGATVVGYGLVQLLGRALPNGLIWSQPLALILTLWVGFVGASMATYEHKHLSVDAVVRLIPPNLRRYVGTLSAVTTALFCFALMWVSIRYVRFSYDEYSSTAGQGGVFAGLPVPKYMAYLALPLSFAIMALRFFGHGVLAYQGRLKEVDPLAGLVDDAAKQMLAASTAAPPSDIPTEAIRPIRDEDDIPRRPKDNARPGVVVGDLVTGRPSEVITDRLGEAAAEPKAAPKTPDDGGAR